jgi:hypothetical protein
MSGSQLRGLGAAGLFLLVWAAPMLAAAQSSPKITITNNCGFPVWLDQTPNGGFSPLAGDGPNPAGKLFPGQSSGYTIPAGGWGGRFWPKIGCDANGNNCLAGSSVSGCPPDGCEPPADTKVEFFYAPLTSAARPYYDISLVDGYTLAVRITPSATDGGRCTTTQCAVSLAACPSDETQGLGSLKVVKQGQIVQCLAPCYKWVYPPPYGMNKSKYDPPGKLMCCPTPPVTSEECRAGPVVQSKYVQLVRSSCPSAYSYAYDDEGGSHDCPPGTSFTATLCP